MAPTKKKQVSSKPRTSLSQLKEMQVSLCATNHAQTKNTYYIKTQILKQLFLNFPSDDLCCSNALKGGWITIIQGLSWHWLKWIVEVEIELYVGRSRCCWHPPPSRAPRDEDVRQSVGNGKTIESWPLRSELLGRQGDTAICQPNSGQPTDPPLILWIGTV